MCLMKNVSFALSLALLAPFAASAEGVSAADVKAAAPCEERAAVRGDALALDLFRELVAERSGNMIFSPRSLEAVLGLLEQGAQGDALELLKGLPGGDLKVASAMKVQSADALFVAEDLKLRRAFDDVRPVPFATNPAEAVSLINAWCAEQTRQLIPSLVDASSVTKSTRMVAANAIYLEERWLHPFPAEQTAPLVFTLSDGSSVRVPMMNTTASFAYAQGDDWAAVALPYREQQPGEPGCMVAVLPRGPLADFVDGLSPEKWEGIRAALAAAPLREVSVVMPTFELCTPVQSLRAAMERRGMSLLFDGADWSGFTAEPLVLSDVLQRCYVKVDEQGTKAAAVTGAMMNRMSIGPRPQTIWFNRPFMWVITDLTSPAAPYFMGVVERPEAPQKR